MSNYEAVRDFLYKYKLMPCNPNLDLITKRGGHLQEEIVEFISSAEDNDKHGVVDALVDLVYIAYGTASMLGLSEKQWNECFARVHQANMTKELVEGDDSHKLGIKKPANWESPNFSDLLEVRYEERF